MDSFIKCFDVVSMVVNEATKQFDPLWEVDSQKYEILKQYCKAIDKLSDEFKGEYFDVEVDDIAMTISIKLGCQDMVIDSKNHIYYELIQRSILFGFSTTTEGLLSINFTFPSIWEKSNRG